MFRADRLNKENYNTINSEEHPEQEDWCLSCKSNNSMTEVTACLNSDKQYQYLSRFPIAVGDIAIIGNEYPAWRDFETEAMATTGQFGSITDKKEKVVMKRDHAAELDFVFKKEATKTIVKQCFNYLLLDDYWQTMQFKKQISPIRPITHFARRILAACSILAHQSLADENAVEMARTVISTPPVLEEKVSELWYGIWAVQIDLNQVFLYGVDNANDLPVIESKGYFREEALLGLFDTIDGAEFVSNPEIQKYIAQYSYIAAVSIMVRGGFVNLLKAFFEQDPPVKDFLLRVKDQLCENGNPEAIRLVSEFIQD